MKQYDRFLSALIICIIVFGSLAFKSKLFGKGTIYCKRTEQGVCQINIDWRRDPKGTELDPCDNGTGKEYEILPDKQCVEVPPPFVMTPP